MHGYFKSDLSVKPASSLLNALTCPCARSCQVKVYPSSADQILQLQDQRDITFRMNTGPSNMAAQTSTLLNVQQHVCEPSVRSAPPPSRSKGKSVNKAINVTDHLPPIFHHLGWHPSLLLSTCQSTRYEHTRDSKKGFNIIQHVIEVVT